MTMQAATLLPGVLGPAQVASCRAALDGCYDDRAVGEGAAFDPYSSSVRLAAVPGLDVDALVRTLYDGDVAAWCRDVLGEGVGCLLDQCWARRQYPLAGYPPRHAAHRWHQDGALGFDFLGAAGRTSTAGALLPLVTCWIALTPCGRDAPGLELAGSGPRDLLRLDALTDDAVRAAHGADSFTRPVLAAGDALAFDGALLHRTHVTASMTRERTSIELRFVATDRLGDRLRADRLMLLH
jgi:ectoine hydroxylase-related dioxygenase (phytanoyl-CoA dioxygenase family)